MQNVEVKNSKGKVHILWYAYTTMIVQKKGKVFLLRFLKVLCTDDNDLWSHGFTEIAKNTVLYMPGQ